jgi:tyrosine-protein phosphatase SIW14
VFSLVVKNRTAPILALSLTLLLAGAPARAASGAAAAAQARPAEWATAVGGTSVGNLYLVEDGLYRGAQPTAAGFQELVKLGVKCVLDVAGGPGDETLIEKGSLKLFHVPMSAFGLRDDRVLQALRIMADPTNRPLLIHCQHGADRTGAIVALYRVVIQGWTPENAVLEMNRGGYHHSSLFRNLETYVLKLDAAALRKRLGVAGPRPEVSASRGSIAAAAPEP